MNGFVLHFGMLRQGRATNTHTSFVVVWSTATKKKTYSAKTKKN